MHVRTYTLLVNDEKRVSRGLVGNETDDLDLAHIVEANDPYEAVWVSPDCLIQLVHNLNCICAAEHGQLPHCPVPPIIVPRRPVVLTLEFKARNELFFEKVLNLLDELLRGEGRKVRQCLELLQVNRRPHLTEEGRQDGGLSRSRAAADGGGGG
ncbi:Rho GTPase activation protein (RhoGAP) with PHdomain [Striga asiatica]|uniref:Rho GTPase activation protein (RhoGAP) with PHdomain n=1 Tax=Striga asiatica TaxID=4170 RepID=A0A5A7QKY2_STRAF|nr:Rho GTPase activation protein (RhoGAP) with PHdomain [Striga asiatica]